MRNARLFVTALVAGAGVLLQPSGVTRAEGQIPVPSAVVNAQPQSPRNASYVIRAAFDPSIRRLTGTEQVHWRNVSKVAASELRIYLYYNSRLSPSTTWMREAVSHGVDVSKIDSSSIDISSLRQVGAPGDLLTEVAYVAADDGNPDDRTVLTVDLANPVAPGDACDLDIAWTAVVPRDAGADGAFFFAHWFPQVGVLSDAGWVAHQAHYAGDVFSDYGVYDVTIDVPSDWQVAATGREEPAVAARAGTHRFVQADVRDFAWAAGRNWATRREQVAREGGLPPIDVALWLRPEHSGQAERIATAISESLKNTSPLSPYVYANLTLVDTAWKSEYAGLAFPTLVTLGTRWLEPRLDSEPEIAVARVVARHFWQQTLDSDGRDQAWMVDGFAAYAAGRLGEAVVRRHLDSTIGQPFLVKRLFGGFVPYMNQSVRPNPALADNQPGGYRQIATLDRYLGWPTFEASMVEYGERFRFGHPAPDDFFRTVESVSGRDLNWLFDRMFRRPEAFDYGVERVSEAADDSIGHHRTTVVVGRYGEGVFPGASRPRVGQYESGRGVEVEIAFSDGTVRTEHWDGRDRVTMFEYESAAPVVRVSVDPQMMLVVDSNLTNNTWSRTPQAASAANRWAARWLLWLEDLILDCAFFV